MHIAPQGNPCSSLLTLAPMTRPTYLVVAFSPERGFSESKRLTSLRAVRRVASAWRGEEGNVTVAVFRNHGVDHCTWKCWFQRPLMAGGRREAVADDTLLVWRRDLGGRRWHATVVR